MFSYFENLLKPFPSERPVRPPATLFSFCWHYTSGAWPWIFLMSLLITLVAAIDVMLYGFLGQIVDWLAEGDKAASVFTR